MIGFVPSIYPLDDGRILEQLLPSRYTLSSNSKDIGTVGEISNHIGDGFSDEREERVGKNTHTNSMMTTVYKVSNDKKKSNETSLVFVNYDTDSHDNIREALQIPSIMLLLEKKEMERLFLESSTIPGVSLERRSSSVIFMRLKGGSIVLFSTQTNVDSTISHLRLASTKDQGIDFLKTDVTIESDGYIDTDSRKSSLVQNQNIVMNSDNMVDVKIYNDNDSRSLSNETSSDNIKFIQNSANKASERLPPPPRFNTLSVVSTNADRKVFQINSREGVPIENEFFVGRLILVLKPQNPQDDPYYNEKMFSKKRRVFEMKFQGRFKYKPENTIFCGIEISERMKLGFVSKGLCNILLKLLSTVNDDIHYSFGDKNEEEYAHIAFPIYSFADSFVESKPGETPPPINSDFPESSESKKSRKKSKESFNWKLDYTYSISFHSMHLNLPAWELINLPMMKNIDMSTFWGEAALRIVLYEKIGKSTQHLKKNNQYIGGIELSYLANSDKFEIEPKNDDTKEDSLLWETRSYSNLDSYTYESDDNDDIKSSDTHTMKEVDGTDYSIQESDTDHEAEYSQDSLQDVTLESDSDLEQYYDAQSRLNIEPYDGKDKSNFSSDYFCPGWIELFGSNKRYKTMYIFCAGDNKSIVIRSFKNVVEHFQFCVDIKEKFPYNSGRFSSREKNRRILGATLVRMQDESFPTFQQKFDTFIKKQPQDLLFLQRKSPTSFSKSKLQDNAIVNGYVARFLNERHCREEWAIVSDKYISFYGLDQKKSSFRIPRRCIVSVKIGSDNYPSYSNFYFLEIETIGKTTYLMFRTQSLRDHWLEMLSTKNLTKSDQIVTVDDTADDYLQSSSLWKLKKRRILNCRNFVFEGPDLSIDHESQVGDLHPCEIVKDALSRVVQLNDDSSNTNELISFLNIVSSLKRVNANKLSEIEKKAFFLNLYHLMVNHAFLVLGFPTSTYNFISYFATICYQCSDDVFSITELEHCIIRAKGSPPSNFVSKFVIPNDQYEFSLNEKDYRINFAMNCGSKSNPKLISLFTPDLIEKQLDYTSRIFLGETVSIKKDRKGVSIRLPRLCNWYLGDFGDGQSDLLSLVRNFMPDDDQKLIDLCLEGSVPYTVKYLPFVFKCQHLVLIYW